MTQIQKRNDPEKCPHNWGLILGFMGGTGAPEAALCCMLCDTFDVNLWEGGLLRLVRNLDVGNGVVVNGTHHNAQATIIVPVDIHMRQTVAYSLREGTVVPDETVKINMRSWWQPPAELQPAQVLELDDDGFYEDDESLEEIEAAWAEAEAKGDVHLTTKPEDEPSS